VGSATAGFGVGFRGHGSAVLAGGATFEVAVHFGGTPHGLGGFSFQCVDRAQTSNNSEESCLKANTHRSSKPWTKLLFSIDDQQALATLQLSAYCEKN